MQLLLNQESRSITEEIRYRKSGQQERYGTIKWGRDYHHVAKGVFIFYVKQRIYVIMQKKNRSNIAAGESKNTNADNKTRILSKEFYIGHENFISF